MKLRVSKNRHAQYNLQYHLILCTKYRNRRITDEVANFLKGEAVRLFGECGITVEEFGYEADHVHMLLSATPQACLGKAINTYKSVSSRHVRIRFADHLKRYYWKPVFWSRTYLVLSSGGAPIEVMREYIQNQGGGG